MAAGTPERIAATAGSATGEYLARVLRGEPLVPLSDVTFAEEAGRTPRAEARTNGHHPTVAPTSARKRATAAAKAR
jgi:hypothetical protein